MKPTLEFYNFFQYIYDYFNRHLFENELPNCMIVITRKNKTFGYYSHNRWINSEQKRSDELAINPLYFSKYPLIEMLQTIAHEMCHSWQQHYGEPSQRNYHNKEWGVKMESIGLMPSHTGKVGGKKTGQQMMDYVLEDGLFIQVCCNLIYDPNFNNHWYDRTRNNIPKGDTTIKISEESRIYKENAEAIHLLYSTFEEQALLPEVNVNEQQEQQGDNEDSEEQSNKKNKIKYQCECSNVWGKPDLNLYCKDCETVFYEA